MTLRQTSLTKDFCSARAGSVGSFLGLGELDDDSDSFVVFWGVVKDSSVRLARLAIVDRVKHHIGVRLPRDPANVKVERDEYMRKQVCR